MKKLGLIFGALLLLNGANSFADCKECGEHDKHADASHASQSKEKCDCDCQCAKKSEKKAKHDAKKAEAPKPVSTY